MRRMRRQRSGAADEAPVPDHVQYGCGFHAPEGWLNFDASPTLRFERLPLVGRLYTRNARRFPERVRYGDIVRGLPVRPRSCRGVYASHVLEHLALADLRRALRNTYGYLADGGIFRLVVPDLESLARTYVRSVEAGDRGAALAFLSESGLGRAERPRGLRALVAALGNAAHLWMWDAASLTAELDAAGFRAIRRCTPGDCDDPAFAAVEDPARFEGAVALECRR